MQRLPARTFQDLVVWQKAHQFVLSVYRITKAFPREEMYGLTSQFRLPRFQFLQISRKDSRRKDVQAR
jgi:hypothetical protein